MDTGRREVRIDVPNHPIHGEPVPSEARNQELMSTPLIHVMLYMNPTLLTLVTLRYQQQPERLFKDNASPLCCFIAANCLYWFVISVVKHISGEWTEILRQTSLSSAILAGVSVVSMFLPFPVSVVPIVLWTLIPVAMAWPHTPVWLREKLVRVRDKIYGMVRSWGERMTQLDRAIILDCVRQVLIWSYPTILCIVGAVANNFRSSGTHGNGFLF